MTFLSVITLLSACNSKNDSVNFGSGFPAYYPIETQPEITPDRQYVYYVRTDTSQLSQDGIYRLKIVRPEREEILAGTGYKSPSSTARQLSLAFVDSSRLVLYGLVDKKRDTLHASRLFNSSLYINDSTLVAGDDTALYRLNTNDSSIVEFEFGWDPTVLDGDTIAFIRPAGVGTYQVIAQTVFDTVGQVVATIPSPERPRWASVEPRLRRFVYAVPNGADFAFYTGEQGSSSTNLVAGSTHPKACMLDFNLLIFSGPDGRFYETDFAGTIAVPFIYHYEGGP
jgi:hypothetical protein